MNGFLIAEVAQAHDGSLGTAHAYIDAAAAAGADAVKFQCHIAAEESTPSEPWRVKFSRQDASRYDYWKRMEFTEPQWIELKSHCDEKRVEFICSPFSLAAVELLKRVGVKRWKAASGEVQSEEMLAAMCETDFPMLVSTGMVGWPEIDRIVERIQHHGNELTLFQCTTAYPCPPEKIGLNVMQEMRSRYGCQVGLSDHSGQVFAGLAAAALGADAIEVHITFSRQSFGPDVPASLTIDEFAELARGVRYIESMLASPVNKDAAADEMAPMRSLFMKSAVYRTDLPSGTVLTSDHLAAKKPGTGVPSARIPELAGKTIRRSVHADDLVQESDFE